MNKELILQTLQQRESDNELEISNAVSAIIGDEYHCLGIWVSDEIFEGVVQQNDILGEPVYRFRYNKNTDELSDL